MKAEIVTKRFVLCPRCNTSSWPIDHLTPGGTWGPWPCSDRNCTASIKGSVGADGSLDIEVSDKPDMALALFLFRGLYLVVAGYSASKEYDFLFHSHQCPENMLRSTIAVFDPETGIDPHGVLRFVAAVPDSEALRDWIGTGCQNGDESPAKLFAKFSTDGVPPPSKWPERNQRDAGLAQGRRVAESENDGRKGLCLDRSHFT